MLAELGYSQANSTILYEDNMSTIAMINNDYNSQKTKHVDIKYNLVREQVNLNIIKMFRLATEEMTSKEMTSDMLTKALQPAPFIHLRRKLLGMYACVLELTCFFLNLRGAWMFMSFYLE